MDFMKIQNDWSGQMAKQNLKDQCTDLTKDFNLQIPCRLAERIEAYATANNATIANVVIEALDTFLREQQNK
jgi:hypothetical protein